MVDRDNKNSGGRWSPCVVLLIVGVVLIQSTNKCSAESGFPSNPIRVDSDSAQDKNGSSPTSNHNETSKGELPATTIVYSTTINDEVATTTVAPTPNAAGQTPEEIIFIASTSAKKGDKDGRQRRPNPVYYGTPSGEHERVRGVHSTKGCVCLKRFSQSQIDLSKNCHHAILEEMGIHKSFK